MVRITSTSIRIMLAEPKEVAIEIRPLIKPIVLNPGKDAGGNQQHHYAGEGVGHSTVGDFQPAKDVFGVETAQELEDRRQQHAANEDGDNVQLRPHLPSKISTPMIGVNGRMAYSAGAVVVMSLTSSIS